MKLVVAIVGNEESAVVQRELTGAGFYATKLSTTGGFLKVGNTTYLIGVSSEKVDSVLAILARHSGGNGTPSEITPKVDEKGNVDIVREVANHGRTTVFVLNVERFEKL